MMKYKLTLMGFVVGFAVFAVGTVLDMDLFEKVVAYLHKAERFELDELIIPAFIFVLFLAIDLYKKRMDAKIEIEKLNIYKAMMFSAHHVLNNFLNQMQLFKLTADETPEFPKEVLSLYDQSIGEATTQIDALGNISKIDAPSIQSSVLPKGPARGE